MPAYGKAGTVFQLVINNGLLKLWLLRRLRSQAAGPYLTPGPGPLRISALKPGSHILTCAGNLLLQLSGYLLLQPVLNCPEWGSGKHGRSIGIPVALLLQPSCGFIHQTGQQAACFVHGPGPAHNIEGCHDNPALSPHALSCYSSPENQGHQHQINLHQNNGTVACKKLSHKHPEPLFKFLPVIQGHHCHKVRRHQVQQKDFKYPPYDCQETEEEDNAQENSGPSSHQIIESA